MPLSQYEQQQLHEPDQQPGHTGLVPQTGVSYLSVGAAASTSKLVVAAAGPIWKTGRSVIADTVGSEPNPGQLTWRGEPVESSPCSLLVEW